MNCKDIKKTYYKYIDGKASQAEYESIRKHLENCPECKKKIESIDKMRTLLQKSGELQISEDYWETYWYRLEKKLPEKPEKITFANHVYDAFSRFFRKPVLIGQIVMAVLVLALALYMVPYSPLRYSKLFQDESRSTAESQEETSLFSRIPEGEEKPMESIAGSVARQGLEDKLRVQPSPPTSDAELDSRLKGLSAGREFAWKDVESKPKTKEDTVELQIQDAEPESAPQEIYSTAEKYFANGEYEKAIESYSMFLKLNEDAEVSEMNLKARYQLGESYYQIGNYPKALSNFVVVANIDDPEIMELGRLDTHKRGRTAGIGYDQKIPKAPEIKSITSPASAKPEAVKLAAQEKKGEISKSERDKLIANAIFRQAQTYKHMKKHEEALKAYQNYLERFPDGEYAAKVKEALDEMKEKR